MCENLYLVEYAVIDYEAPFTSRGKKYKIQYGKIRKEIVNEIGLAAILLQEEDGLTEIYGKPELVRGRRLSTNERIIEYRNSKGFVVGTVVKKREDQTSQ